MAGVHAEMIKKGNRIKHGIWGGVYLVAAGAVSFFSHSWLLMVCLLVLRKWSFDLSLNVFRGFPTFYVSKKPKSIIDQFHNWVFGLNSIPYMVFYFICTIVLSLKLVNVL
jgi:hypothetical protein